MATQTNQVKRHGATLADAGVASKASDKCAPPSRRTGIGLPHPS
jgi:hypothetical protein